MQIVNVSRWMVGLLAGFAAMSVLSACDASVDSDDSTKVNGSIHVHVGKEAGDVRTVNGSIHVDDGAAVTSAKTVNGSIKVGANATATTLHTVNGGVSMGVGAHASEIVTVNGDLTLNSGAEVTGSITNVNGKITVSSAHVAGLITTSNGGITITGDSHVDGGILVKKPGGVINFGNNEDPTIIIGPGATVQGELRFERKVKLYVSDKAAIGTVTGATAVPFTGDSPSL